MFQDIRVLIALAVLFAALPVAIWLYLFFHKANNSKKTVAVVFAFGCLTAPALLGLQKIWGAFPRFDLAAFVENSIEGQTKEFIAMFILFAALEEIIKMVVVAQVDKKTLFIKTISDALRYSLVSALGFAFSENIYYMYQWWPVLTTGEFVGMYIFRAAFTTAAHMIFSGIFAYFYGIGKFSIDIDAQEKLSGVKNRFADIISAIFRLPKARAYQQSMIFKGLIIAIVMHATYNFILQYNYKLPVILAVIAGYFYLQFLLKRKSGDLILVTDVSTKKKSSLAKNDEDVVIELMGLWFNDKRYVDVIHICERLLERDPDNNVVKLFKAKAMDKIDEKSTYKKILGTVIRTSDDISTSDKNIISKYTDEKEMLEKVKQMVKAQAEKEGKKIINTSPKNEEENSEKTVVSKPKENVLEDLTGEGSFDIKL